MELEKNLNPAEKMLVGRAKERRRPIYGSLELLPLCNMNCDMCYVRLSKQEMESQGRLRTAEEWLALGREMAESGVLYLQLTGGEPLLYPGFHEVYLGLKKLGMILTVNTNGTLINEEWAAFFAAHKPRRMNISLYGSSDEAYSRLCHYPGGFYRTIEAIRSLRAHGVDVKLNVMLTNANKSDLDWYYALSRELDVPINVDTYLFPATRERQRIFSHKTRPSPEEVAAARIRIMQLEMGEAVFRQHAAREVTYIDSLPDQLFQSRRLDCLAGSCSFVVNWQGMLRPCIMMKNPEVSVFDTGFEQGWQQIHVQSKKLFLPTACGHCRMRSICGVCAASMEEEISENGAPSYLCRTAEAMLKLLRSAAEGSHG